MITERPRGSAHRGAELFGAPDMVGRRTHAVTFLTIYAAMLMFIPSPLIVAPFGGSGSPATLFAVAVLGWYLALWVHPAAALDRERQPVRGAAILFAGVTLAAYVSANRNALPSLFENAADRGLISMAGWLGVLLLAADGIGRWDELQTMLRRIVTAGAALAGLGITQFVTGFDVTKYVMIPGLIRHMPVLDLGVRDGLNRPTATTGQPLELAAVLALCLPLALHQARFAAPGRRVRWWLQAGLIAMAMPMTISRSAVLALAVIAITLIPTWPKRDRRAAYCITLGAVVTFWVSVPRMVPVFDQLFAQIGAESSSTSRIDAYSAAAQFIFGHPWLGQGFQTFFPQTYFFIDNQYLTSLIETGVAGLLALAAMLATGWLVARKARRTVSDARTRDLLQCLAASVAAAAVSFATFDALSFTVAPGLTFLILGCAGAAWRLVGARPPSRSRLARTGRRARKRVWWPGDRSRSAG